MLVSRQQNASQNQDIKTGNKSFESATQIERLPTAITNENLIKGEIERRLKSGNAGYHLGQNVLSSRLVSET
jgi:hypothetical protein